VKEMTDDRVANDELREGWCMSPLAELGQLQLGKMLDAAKNTGQAVPYLRNINVRWFSFDLADLKDVRVTDDEREKLSVHDGDLFICEGGEPGRCAVWNLGQTNMVYQKALHRFRTSGAILPKLLMYRLRQEAEIGSLHESFTGTTIKHLTRETLQRYEVPVPPLAEQKRIADKLEAVLGRVDACRARLDRVPALLKRFRQSVLAAATSGQLTEDWREKQTHIASAQEATIGDICDITSGFGFPKHLQGKEDGKYPFAKVSDISRAVSSASGQLGSAANYVDESDLKELKAKPVPKGSTVFAKIGEAVRLNRRALATCSLVIDNNCMALTPDTMRVLPEFVFLFMQTVDLSPFAVATTVPSVRRGDVESIGLTLFSLPEQTEIVRRVDALFALADRIEARLATAQRLVERLTPATLSKAFRGDLVPQDPNDEPASTLLARLSTGPASKASQKRQGRV